jgi:2-succinyl-5-enolpyruvyl-6-hydroxy-3-cyclohexene-1-carboxylate synthase
MSLVIYCADIGSVSKGNFGWARLAADELGAPCATGWRIAEFAEAIADDVESRAHAAVGFECPLFLPLPEEPEHLTSARPGEGNRPWSAAAGAVSLAAGLTETVWILDRVKRHVSIEPKVFVDWRAFRAADGGLFVWEAFVTKPTKAHTHQGDAELAVRSFQESLPNPERNNAVVVNGRVRSLFGAALLQAGFVEDLEWLRRPCLVVRVQPRAA